MLLYSSLLLLFGFVLVVLESRRLYFMSDRSSGHCSMILFVVFKCRKVLHCTLLLTILVYDTLLLLLATLSLKQKVFAKCELSVRVEMRIDPRPQHCEHELSHTLRSDAPSHLSQQ
jgi:hypothetical protein